MTRGQFWLTSARCFAPDSFDYLGCYGYGNLILTGGLAVPSKDKAKEFLFIYFLFKFVPKFDAINFPEFEQERNL